MVLFGGVPENARASGSKSSQSRRPDAVYVNGSEQEKVVFDIVQLNFLPARATNGPPCSARGAFREISADEQGVAINSKNERSWKIAMWTREEGNEDKLY